MQPDYKLMWEELKKVIRSYEYCTVDELPKHYTKMEGIHFIYKIMSLIESRHQPKQYTWSEIITMAKLPKTIESSEQYQYSLCQLYGKSNYVMKFNETWVQPSIQEMKNLWTIIE